ncbi:MAG: bifunctional phosphoribosyl-AMP cyclohydrolase/phosphoribosyl-ATP diphosphatase HisIE [Alphaproteobacteria bacterium]|nr:bifunctional phosphoribosyl-AMP cyclohydrolase/phosphoribosyl-ATP diphosphatase HisIE [Alphaproteobacteria bacterium]
MNDAYVPNGDLNPQDLRNLNGDDLYGGDLNWDHLNWDKVAGLMPVIIQDIHTREVLMMGYMNREALAKTCESGHVTFFSRTKQRLWMKGESSGHVLNLIKIYPDCDGDTLLILADPVGPTCHTGSLSCFGETPPPALGVLNHLSHVIHERHVTCPPASYTTSLFVAGRSRISQKVGEEGVELALAHMEQNREAILNEAADLIFHMMVLLENSNLSIYDVCTILDQRNTKRATEETTK